MNDSLASQSYLSNIGRIRYHGDNHIAALGHVYARLPFGGAGFDYRDEFFRVYDPYSRGRVRVLLSIDTEKTDLTPRNPRWKQEREDNDYALAWVRNYGRGRVFYRPDHPNRGGLS